MRIPKARTPKARNPRFDFGGLDRHWFGGNAVATHIANGVNLLFPAGERFFVRSVHHYLDRIEDPTLRERVRGFSQQEGRHANAHERYFDELRAQGYDIDRFLELYEAIAYGTIERLATPALRLATTAACEHFTAIMAEHALARRVLDHAAKPMRDLLLWHAAEEIEHRSVAFDVLQAMAPSYPLRAAGMAIAAACLGGFWFAATLTLLAQEKELTSTQKLRQWRRARDERDGSVFARGILEYLAPSFHPDANPIDRVADEYFASAGL